MKKTFINMLSGILIGGLLMTSGAIALAGDETAVDKPNLNRPGFAEKIPGGQGPGMPAGVLEDVLETQVKNGALNQQEADNFLNFIKEQAKQRQQQNQEFKKLTPEERKALRDEKKGERTDLFEQAVKQSIITEKQAEAIQEAMKTRIQTDCKALIEGRLDHLVTDKTISQQQAQAILEQIEKNAAEQQAKRQKMKNMTEAERQEMMEQRKAEREKIRNMTEEERQEYIQKNKARHQPFQELIDNGTLTQEQAQTVQKALRPGRCQGKPGANQ